MTEPTYGELLAEIALLRQKLEMRENELDESEAVLVRVGGLIEDAWQRGFAYIEVGELGRAIRPEQKELV